MPATERSLDLAMTAAKAADDKLATTVAGIDVSANPVGVKQRIGVTIAVDVLAPHALERSLGKAKRISDQRR